jgi:hypothetical protein
MRRERSGLFLVISFLITAGAAALIIHRVTRHSPHPAAEEAGEIEAPVAGSVAVSPGPPQELGRAKLAITIPSGAGLTSVSYAVVSPGHTVVERGSAPVEEHAGVVTPPVITLPSGNGYRLSVVGKSALGGSKHVVYLGATTFDVPANHETPVSFTPAAAGDGVPSSATTPVDSAVACQSCELSSDQGICTVENLTATSRMDPKTGDQTGVGWGCGTLADAKAQSACLALLRCLNANGCERSGENPVAPCYCGTAAPEQCIGGLGINGACIAEYQAAARVSSGGPGSTAGTGQLSQFIATVSGDPTTPIGLADGIKLCASESHCDACQTL